MEGKKYQFTHSSSLITHHPHLFVLIFVLILGLTCNVMMIHYIGYSSLIDSYNNPDEYLMINNKLLFEYPHDFSHCSVLIQKQSIIDANLWKNNLLCFLHPHGYYIVQADGNLTDLNYDTTLLAGKVISIIPNNPLSEISCLWWQKTTQIIQYIG